METKKALLKICRFYPSFQDDLWYTEHYIAKELNKEGIKTTFVTSERYRKSWSKYVKKYYPSGYFMFDHYDVYRLRALFPLEQTIFINWIKLFNLLFRNNNSIIHLYGYGTLATLQIFLLSLFAGKNRPPLLFSDHTDTRSHAREGKIPDLFFRVLGCILNLFRHRYKYIITFGEVGEKVLTKKMKVPSEKFHIIPLGFDQDIYYFKSGCKNTETKLLIGFAGKISPQKRVDFLISQLSSEEFVERVKLIVIGITNDSYCKSILKLAAESSLESEFRPFADSKTLSDFYNYIDLAVFPGGISITTIEANGCGTPVLIYESIEGLSERVIDGRGMLFKSESEFRDRIRSFIEMYDKNEINNRKIGEETMKKSSWAVIKEQYKEIYKKCLNNED